MLCSLKFWYKVSRLEQCLIAGVSAWLIALLSNGPLWFTTPKIAAASCIFFSCLGASMLHYGMRYDIYLLKWWDLVEVKNPRLLVVLGNVAFITSIITAAFTLPRICTIIAGINYLILLFYSGWLDKYWPMKNLVIAIVCLSPITIGWFSGHRMHPAVPPLLISIFCVYMTREMLKDIVDVKANRGKRFTMVMSLGEPITLRIAGIFMLIAMGGFAHIAHSLPASALVIVPFSIACIIYLAYTYSLLRSLPLAKYYRGLDLGTLMLMISIFSVRAGLP